MDKELIWTIVLAIISSAAFSALINGIFSLIIKKADEKNKKEENKQKIKDDYLQKKESVYISAINWLLSIRRGFDFTTDDLRKDNTIRDNYINNIEQFQTISAKLRLYSTDSIYVLFSYLNKYQEYSYSDNWRLSEEDKVKFVDSINVLSDLMKADLHFRQYDDKPKTICCPVCKKEHDYIKTCECGLTFQQYLDIERQNIKVESEMKTKDTRNS